MTLLRIVIQSSFLLEIIVLATVFDSVRADGAHTDTRAFAFLFVAVHFVSSFCLIV